MLLSTHTFVGIGSDENNMSEVLDIAKHIKHKWRCYSVSFWSINKMQITTLGTQLKCANTKDIDKWKWNETKQNKKVKLTNEQLYYMGLIGTLNKFKGKYMINICEKTKTIKLATKRHKIINTWYSDGRKWINTLVVGICKWIMKWNKSKCVPSHDGFRKNSADIWGSPNHTSQSTQIQKIHIWRNLVSCTEWINKNSYTQTSKKQQQLPNSK